MHNKVKLNEQAYLVLQQGLQFFADRRILTDAALITMITQSGLINYLTQSGLASIEHGRFTLKVWVLLVRILGLSLDAPTIKKLNPSNRDLLNELLKLIQEAFQADCYFQSALEAWRTLVDIFTEPGSILASDKSTPKQRQNRVDLIMAPFLKYKNEEKCTSEPQSTTFPRKSLLVDAISYVANPHLQQWWHFICRCQPIILESLFSKVCIPFIETCLSPNIRLRGELGPEQTERLFTCGFWYLRQLIMTESSGDFSLTTEWSSDVIHAFKNGESIREPVTISCIIGNQLFF